jgi:hypothetical protein
LRPRLYGRHRFRRASCSLSTWRPGASISRPLGFMWRLVLETEMWRLVPHTEHQDTVGRDTVDRDTVDRDTVDRDTVDRDTGHPGPLTEPLRTTEPLDQHTPHRQHTSSRSRSTHPLMRQNMYRGRPPLYLTTVVVVASSISAMAGGDTAIEASLHDKRKDGSREPSEAYQGQHPFADRLSDLFAKPRPSHRLKRAAHALMPPFRLMN